MALPLMVITMVLFVRIFETGEGCAFGPGCTYECHCEGEQPCDPNTGDCPNGCDDGVLSGPYGYRGAWSGYGCQIGNQAYLKTATQGQATWPDENDNQAYRAVDGNLNPDLNQDSCVHPVSYNGQDPWWQVDLGAQFVIVSVNITNRLDQEKDRLSYAFIEVSQDGAQYHRCAVIGDVGEPPFVDRVCNTKVLGRYVRLRRLRSAHEGNAMNFCEVQVYAYQYEDCPDGFFGIACHTACPSDCLETCDDVTGNCSAGCIPGKMGDTCQEDCPPLRWGSNCVNDCGCSDPTEVCDPMNGQCMSGCRAELAGLSCDIIRPSLLSTVYLQQSSSTSITVSFAAWAPDNGGGDPPTHYRAQYSRSSNGPWNDGHLVTHTDGMNTYRSSLGSLITSDSYYVRVIPVIIISGYGQIYGNPTQVAGPIVVVAPSSTMAPTTTAGLAIGIILVVLLVAAGVLIWRFQPEFIQKLRRRHEPKLETPYNDIYSAIIEEVPSKSLPMDELPGFMNVTKNSPIGFETEYNEVVRHASQQSTSSDSGNTNRYEHLGALNGNSITPFNFETYGSNRKHYMLLQGNQLNRTNLWQIVWQAGAESIIVFGDDLKEDLINGREYEAGEITISTEFIEELSDYTIQQMNMSHEDVRRKVHVHVFLSWEEGAIPGNAAAIIDFRRKSRQRERVAEVEIVVCSDNLDRGGTFLAIDYSLHQAAAENKVDVYRYCVHLLTECTTIRITKEQYGFVYDAVLEYWESRHTAALVTQFCAGDEMDATHSRDLFAKLDYLRQSPPPNKHTYRGNDFPEKNRTPDIIPADCARPILRTDIEEMGDYINAVYVNSYRNQQAYIATQAPMNTTVHDMWRLVYDSGARTIIMLNGIDGDMPTYWPLTSVTSLGIGKLTVLHKEEHAEESGVTSRIFSVKGEDGEERQVKQLQVTNWSDHDDSQGSCDALMNVLQLAQEWTHNQATTPIVVHCRDGAQKTGLCCAAMFIIDQLQAEEVVDIFHAIRRVQANRPQFILSEKQVAFLYRFVRKFIDSNRDYANQ